MTFGEIYERCQFKLWGNSTIEAETLEVLRRLIVDSHRRIQQNRNYGFMEEATIISIVAATSTYTLPTDFKELYKHGLRFINDDGNYGLPLAPLVLGNYSYFRDGDQDEEFPRYYEIFGDELILYLIPSENETLHMRYYKYLFPTSNLYDQAYTDSLTERGEEVIINLASAEMAFMQKEMSSAQVFLQQGNTALEILNSTDTRRRYPEINRVKYKGF